MDSTIFSSCMVTSEPPTIDHSWTVSIVFQRDQGVATSTGPSTTSAETIFDSISKNIKTNKNIDISTHATEHDTSLINIIGNPKDMGAKNETETFRSKLTQENLALPENNRRVTEEKQALAEINRKVKDEKNSPSIDFVAVNDGDDAKNSVSGSLLSLVKYHHQRLEQNPGPSDSAESLAILEAAPQDRSSLHRGADINMMSDERHIKSSHVLKTSGDYPSLKGNAALIKSISGGDFILDRSPKQVDFKLQDSRPRGLSGSLDIPDLVGGADAMSHIPGESRLKEE
ncbi:hypothetical protein PoB_003479700 [Plakobranchus ocellatus]|uniref:Uncharacterized protein n=1 Tax=Plakobranchus ocellatus TaxID=259542 RepID=A0AAV4AMZ2_9GAST|nr:hypothetical protein PoB_003479700 [Plakobranchus ocellatus]